MQAMLEPHSAQPSHTEGDSTEMEKRPVIIFENWMESDISNAIHQAVCVCHTPSTGTLMYCHAE